MIQLESHWSFWYHSSKNRNWDSDSYQFLFKTQYAEEFWGIFKLLTLKHYESGIIFIMRNDVFPDWASPENINGGFISIKIDTKNRNENPNNVIKISKMWIEKLISETITNETKTITHGISLSPKSGHCILKLWLNEKVKNVNRLLCSDLPLANTNKFTAFTHKHS